MEKEITINDIRQLITDGYAWLQSNDDFTFIRNSAAIPNIADTDGYLRLRHELEEYKVQTRGILGDLSIVVEGMGGCIGDLRITIERHKTIIKQARKNERYKRS